MNKDKFYANCLENDLKILPIPTKSKKPIYKWDQNIKSIDELNDYIEKNSNFAFLTGENNDFIVIDVDKKHDGLETLEVLKENGFDLFKLSKFIVKSGGGGYHFYFKHDPSLEVKNLATKIGIDIRANGGIIVGPYSTHENGNIYEIITENKDALDVTELTNLSENFFILLKRLNNEKSEKFILKQDFDNFDNSPFRQNDNIFIEGHRNEQVFKYLCKRSSEYANLESFKKFGHFVNQTKCKPPLLKSEIEGIIKNVFQNYRSSDSIQEISNEAYIGPLGKFIFDLSNYVEPCKESLLIQSLVVLGNLLNKKFYISISGNKLNTNLFAIILGKTSKARKGTSKRIVETIFRDIWGDELRNRTKRGLSSGEGLIHSLRDPAYGVKENKNGEQITVLIDQGIENKNAIYYEEEFSRVLKSSKRDTNNITEVIREAYDSGNLSVLTRNNPLTATNTNVSIIAQSTIEEFKNILKNVDCDNGFYNRFIFCKASRANVIPHTISPIEIDAYHEFKIKMLKVKSFIELTNELEMEYSKDAMKLWEKYYLETAYSDEINGNIKGRSEDQLQKVAMIYAISECSETIETRHLLASKAILDYCHQTIDYVFSSNKSEDLRDYKVLKYLKNNYKVSRSKIFKDVFKNKIKGFEMDQIRDRLLEKQFIDITQNENTEIWSIFEMSKLRNGELSEKCFSNEAFKQ